MTSSKYQFCCACRVAVAGVDAESGGLRRLKSKIDVPHAKETPDQQSGAYQQHAGQGHLGHHQEGTNPAMLPAVDRTLAGIFQCLVKVEPGDLKRRRQSEH